MSLFSAPASAPSPRRKGIIGLAKRPLARLGLLLIAPLALAACDPHQTGKVQDRITLSTTEPVMSYRFARGGTQLTGADQQKLRRLIQQTGIGAQDRIIVSLPAAATAPQTRAREAHLRGLLAATGAQIDIVGDRPGQRRTHVEDQGVIRMIQAHKMTVSCPENGGLPSGCTQSRNLAVMLAEPADLRYPRELQKGKARPPLPKQGAEAAAAPPQRGTAPAQAPQ